MARFDNAIAKQSAETQTNGHTSTPPTSASPPPHSTASPTPSKKHKPLDSDELSESVDAPTPKKKRKVEPDSDAAYAAKLQAMENSRMRSTRGGGAKASKPAKKKAIKKKSAGKVKAEDDSDLDGSGSEVKERKVNRNTGFHKELTLSAPLSALLDNETKVLSPGPLYL